MKLKFASWNINNRNFTNKHIDFIRSTDCDVIALQECKQSFYDDLLSQGLFQNGAFSLILRPPSKDEGRARKLGCAVLTKSSIPIHKNFLLEDTSLPERTMVIETSIEGKPILFCSFHIPPGASWGKIKPETFKIIAKWLSKRSSPIIFGIDANAPKTDCFNHIDNEWWWKDEPVLLGVEPSHDLVDTFRTFLEENPEKLQAIKKERPDGPLAVSYIRGDKRKYTPSRYDFIYATTDFEIIDVQYLFDEALIAGSDHALVLAELDF